MFRTNIKLCGLRSEVEMLTAIRLAADFAGFVFFAKSPRNIPLKQARELADISQTRIKRVGIFVDSPDRELDEAITAGRLDVLQFHGKEAPERVIQAKQRFGLPIWKAVGVATEEDIHSARKFRGSADLILFDAKTSDSAPLPGGMGLRFDWELLRGFGDAAAWGLSGGLHSDNVGQALARTGAALVDVSSGIESKPGVKDMDKMAAFCEAVRQHDCIRSTS